MIADLIWQAYGTRPLDLQPVGNDPTGERLTYRVALDDGRVVTVRGQRIGGQVPFWHGAQPAEEWLSERARILDWLAEQGYPAPRVLRTVDGGAFAVHGAYCALTVTFLPGQPLSADTSQAQRLAQSLGRLHTLGTLSGTHAPRLPASWWYPLDTVIGVMLDRLQAARSVTPEHWLALHTAFMAALDALHRRDDLPRTVIHGDCYPGNAIVADDGQVALIDWECAGWGCAALDLGALLLDAHPDPAPGGPVMADRELVAALAAGYRRERQLSDAELDSLPDAMRFGVAWVGALRFIWGRDQGWSERLERSLTRLRARYTAAEEVARLAREAFQRAE